MALEDIAAADEVPLKGSLVVAHGGEQVLLVRSEAGVFAVENRCSHAYQKLHGGKVRKVFIFCPLHGVRFDLRNGCPSGDLTDTPIKAWKCAEEGGRILVDLDQRLDAGAQ